MSTCEKQNFLIKNYYSESWHLKGRFQSPSNLFEKKKHSQKNHKLGKRGKNDFYLKSLLKFN